MFPSLSEYLQILHTYCGKTSSKSKFVLIIFENFIANLNDKNLYEAIALFRMDESDLLKIFNGKRVPSKKNLRAILSDIDKGRFRDFVNESTTDDSRILLSNDFEKYVGQATHENIGDKLADLFESILDNLVHYKNQKSIVSTNNFTQSSLEQELTEIVKCLANLSDDEFDIKLQFEPVKIEEKIYPEFHLLKRQIKQDVVEYYRFIEHCFKDESNKNSLFFNNLAINIKTISDSLIKQNFPQQHIFETITKWIQDKSYHKNEIACRIIASFFVQNCEVFYAITK